MAAVSKPPCPCSSGAAYADCCEPLHEGGSAASPEALMRSRYSAYALGLYGYVLSSWHPSTRPKALEDDRTEWRKLQIVDVSGDVVEFRASFRGGLVHERSRFVKEGGRWLYVDGVMLD